MKHTYQIDGMTCNNCVAKVKSAILKHPEVLKADIQLDAPQAEITMQQHVTTAELQDVVSGAGQYTISDADGQAKEHEQTSEKSSWFATYKPILLIFAFVSGIAALASYSDGGIQWMEWMQYFMAGFFIAFSFFKFLDLKGFAVSYRTYDLLAKRLPAYGYVYPFLELALGIAYLTAFNPVLTNSATVIIMSFSSIGVIQSVVQRKTIQCACLGTVFNLPMSTVTIIEDLLMVAMAAWMLVFLV